MWIYSIAKAWKPTNKLLKIQAEDFIPNVWNNIFLKILFLDEHIQHVRCSPDMEMYLPSSQTINHDVLRPRPKSLEDILAAYFEFPDAGSSGFTKGFSCLPTAIAIAMHSRMHWHLELCTHGRVLLSHWDQSCTIHPPFEDQYIQYIDVMSVAVETENVMKA